MSGRLDDRYFEWLYGNVASVRNRNPARSYWKLSRQLHTKEFIWFVPNDDNRIEDGKELRTEYVHEQETDEVDSEWMNLGCSMLEMLIALARRAAYESDKSPDEWFGIFLQNLEIIRYTDVHYSSNAQREIDDAVERIIYRNYAPNGEGGLFPLQNPPRDQRRVELWYQLSAYILEVAPP